MTKKQLNILFLFALAFSFWRCASSEKSGLLGQVYHNTTAQYNAYYLGSERLTAAEAKLTTATIDDYNQILTFFPSTDTSITSQFRPEMEEVIKKASFAIKKHPKSRWTGDSYILVGKARYYMGDYDEAIRTFRFVNTGTKKDQVRFRAQVWLMRSFVAQRDFESADAVSDLLKKVRLNKNNAIHLFLNRADYYLLQKDTSLAITNLKLAIPIMRNKDYQARARFILAQLYQRTNNNKQAYEVYSKILKKNPPYELGFYSKLNLGQVTELSDPNDKARIEKYYSKLLKDAKNIDFRDKIYYEMAQFALKQKQYDLALNHLRQSTKASTNENQKSYSYLLAGKTYYENLQKYSLAAAYYDSAVQVMPPNSAEYLAASERRDILKEFSTHYTTIQTQDSLQALARLDSASLNKRISAILETAAKKAQQDQQRQQNNGGLRSPLNLNPGQNGQTNRPSSFNTNSGGTWYFDNPTSVARARAEFTQRWGNRKLQDNWRVSDMEASAIAQNTNSPAGPDSTGVSSDSAAANPATVRQDLLQNIPIGAERMQASNNQVEEAMFGLGGIYQQQLNEPVRAAETYEKLLQRFPATKYKSEVYYSLYLLNHQQKNDRAKTYADLVKREFPGSKYAKLIDQPDYLQQVSANNKKARQLYDSAFVHYHYERYPVAITLINQVQKQYPDSDLTDRVAFLKVLITGRTQKPAVFKTAVRQFMEKYPSSTLLSKAEELLASFEAYESGKLSEAEFNKTHPKKTIEPFSPEPESVAVEQTESVAEQTEEPPIPTEAEVQPSRRRGRPRKEPVPEVASEPADPATSNDSTATDPVAVAEEPIADQETPAADQQQNSPAEPSAEPAPDNSIPEASSAGTANSPATTTPPPAATPIYATNLALPHVVVIAYPKTHPAFKDVYTKMTSYNAKYNQIDQLSIDSATFSGATNFLVIKEFNTGKKAVNYATKQKAPQSPLSKIRGIEFTTFAISSENLPILLKEGKLEDYLTFYKNNYF